mmetsp:Transcript_21845/g.49389  ORF Transcript_21845/g.49389 Transcript_21845/m.49389 type:complete len:324 (-) Transcript_21845:136-1107(-)
MVLVKGANAVLVVLGPRALDDVPVVVDVLGLLALDEPLVKFIEDPVRGEELDLLAVSGDAQDLGDQVLCHLFGLRRQHAKGEFPELRGRVVEQELGEHHPGAQNVAVHLARTLLLLVALHPFLELGHEGVGHLRQPTLRGAVHHVTRRPAALDPATHRVEDVPRDARLRCHELHGLLRAEQGAEEVHFHDGLDGPCAQLGEGPPPAVDPRVVHPVVDSPEPLLGEGGELGHLLGRAHVAHGAVDFAARVPQLERLDRQRGVLDVADHHRVPALEELVGVGEPHPVRAARDHHPKLHGHRAALWRHRAGRVEAQRVGRGGEGMG